MKPTTNAELMEGELATFWFDENGILCAIANNTPRTMENKKRNYEFINKITGNKKVCLITDITTSSPNDKATRDYVANEISKVFIAMALISNSALGIMIANTFLAIKKKLSCKGFYFRKRSQRMAKNPA